MIEGSMQIQLCEDDFGHRIADRLAVGFDEVSSSVARRLETARFRAVQCASIAIMQPREPAMHPS